MFKNKKADQCSTSGVRTSGQNRKLFVICFLMVIFIGVLYFNSLGNQFTNWDDSMIYGNSQVRSLSWENIGRIFTYQKGNTYQPIRILSYAFDYHFWELNPLGYHITSIFFYILTCVMVYLTLHHLSINLRGKTSPDSHVRVALFGSLLFAAHPVHVEAVTWLAARKEVLQGFFFFSAFYLYMRGRERTGRNKILFFSLCLFSILLAILSKPAAVIFPGILLAYEVAKSQSQPISFIKKHLFFFSLSFVLSAIFAFILMKVMFEAGGVKPYRGGTFFNNLLISFYSLLYHLKLLIITTHYSAAYTINVSNPIPSLRTFLFVGITFLMIGLSLWSLRKTKVVFFSLFFFLINVLPYINIIPISILLADRYVFIASFSYCFILGILFDRFYAYQNRRYSEGFFKLISLILFMVLLLQYSFVTIQQNRIWRNSYTLWANAVEHYPESNTANALMGVVFMEIGMDEKALKYLEKAIQILPYDYQSRNNLGIVYGRQDQPERAFQEFMIAMQLAPEDDTIKVNLAVFYQRQKEYDKAEAVWRYLLKRSPGNSLYYFRLAMLYKEMGQYRLALSELEKASALSPHIINPYEEMGNIYLNRLNDEEKAKFYYQKGIEAAPKAKAKVEDLRWVIQDLQR